MKRIFLLISGLILIFLVSCIFNPPNNNDNNNPNDTIIGWERAGINSTGDSSQNVDVCHYGVNLFTFNYRGELFGCTYPELIWRQMNIPNNQRACCILCDTINGLLYVSTIECGVYEYSIVSESWRGLFPHKNNWFDSTKLLDGKLYINMYDVVVHKNKLFIMTAQGWKDSLGKGHYWPTVWCSERDTVWEKADSGWYNNMGNSDCITDFFSIDDYLYASTFEAGLWRYDGVSWMAIPGTRFEDVYFLDTSGGDTKSIPGFRPRSMVKHNNDIYVGNLGGRVHKMLPGFNWENISLFFLDYNANTIYDFSTPSMSLYSFNDFLIKATYYYNDSAKIWYNMTPYFNKIDPSYNNALPGTVYGMTNIGDTLFAAMGDNYNKHSGVYFLDLKKCKFYQKFH